jgi:predicted MPP superfamily phosphohydrolase
MLVTPIRSEILLRNCVPNGPLTKRHTSFNCDAISCGLLHQMSMATIEQQPVAELHAPSIRVRITGFVLTIQAILFAVHWFIYQTWVSFHPETDSLPLPIIASLLSVSFIIASLLAFRFWNVWVRVSYRLAAVWLGFLNFFFLAACLSWVALLASRALGLSAARPPIAGTAFGLAVLAGLYGLLNARFPRVKRVAVQLSNLPPSWRGRVAALVTDVHLGHINGASFLRRIVNGLRQLRPDVVFISGDLFDGSHADFQSLAAPWKQLSPSFGIHFVTGNHEEFSERTKYLRAVADAGINVLNNKKIILDDLQILGVHDRESSDPDLFRSILESARIDRSRASILLTHVPRALHIPEDAGISLQLSGHTHGGQIFPFTWFTHRIFADFTYGLNRFANLLVYTSYGAGTWGPPMRFGTTPEIVLIEFK